MREEYGWGFKVGLKDCTIGSADGESMTSAKGDEWAGGKVNGISRGTVSLTTYFEHGRSTFLPSTVLRFTFRCKRPVMETDARLTALVPA